ncbi:type B 50S ribosomal protein L31 [Larsenimonas suaedae]|uniref:Large ribosomal subunit protein bL31B n=1 Tax=Larsenimonas suaedae TaxID=1851019 RepID=A0ABU1GXJ4_9GAMM|nr:type B 50S ribosomal protein L31 [Larsenimonas suaedae]MCM2973123.1 type B 50S ribosomal protein L31 [Larsenimonas suaedae]MDR5896560.1 type B 50S ribosomal protein L31 [Larsenimonas suaedae]
MKSGIHPEYRKVVFYDTSADVYFKTGSTMSSSETIEWEDGNSYPLIRLDISSASHPFYTGKQRSVGTEGRAAQFKRRFGSLGARRS